MSFPFFCKRNIARNLQSVSCVRAKNARLRGIGCGFPQYAACSISYCFLLRETKNQVCRHVDPRSVFRQKRQPIRRNIALRKIILRKNTIRFASFFWNFPGNDFDFCFLSALSRAVLFALIQQRGRCGNGRKRRCARRPKFGK